MAVVASCLTQSVGLHQSLALLAAGGTLVLLEGYDIARMADAIHRYRPTHLIMVVNAFDRLHHPSITAASLASVRFAAVGADRVTRRVQERHIALTGRPLHVSYGMSESSWAIVNLDGRSDKCLALGKPAPGVAIRLVDEQGLEVPPGATGEIQIRSPRTMPGYLHDPALTQAAFTDGWLRSGDLAWRDDEGYFWFAGRSKHIIVLGSGDNVSPVEIEQALLGHHGVARCLVAATTAAEDGSEVRAHSWCAPTRRCAPASCSITCAARLSAFGCRARSSSWKSCRSDPPASSPRCKPAGTPRAVSGHWPHRARGGNGSPRTPHPRGLRASSHSCGFVRGSPSHPPPSCATRRRTRAARRRRGRGPTAACCASGRNRRRCPRRGWKASCRRACRAG
ncbi:MAG: long-chain fatty acid--CoA ligase [Gammaproteobacteria bacterium]|nr:long-chain fatty acid--CoA ligase [Gammaproteobacteria bacterium]